MPLYIERRKTCQNYLIAIFSVRFMSILTLSHISSLLNIINNSLSIWWPCWPYNSLITPSTPYILQLIWFRIIQFFQREIEFVPCSVFQLLFLVIRLSRVLIYPCLLAVTNMMFDVKVLYTYLTDSCQHT